MKKTIRLTEKDLSKIIENIMNENMGWANMQTFKNTDETVDPEIADILLKKAKESLYILQSDMKKISYAIENITSKNSLENINVEELSDLHRALKNFYENAYDGAEKVKKLLQAKYN